MAYWLFWIRVTWKSASVGKALDPPLSPWNAGNSSPLWKVTSLSRVGACGVWAETRLTPELRNSGPKSVYKQGIFLFFTNLLLKDFFLFRFLTKWECKPNFLYTVKFSQIHCCLPKKYKKLPAPVISLSITYNLPCACIKSMLLLLIWPCINLITSPVRRTTRGRGDHLCLHNSFSELGRRFHWLENHFCPRNYCR